MGAFITGSLDSRATLIFNSVASKIQCFGVEVKNVFEQLVVTICLPVRLLGS